MRNERNYAADLEINDVSQTGIKKDCHLNILDGYHVTKNLLLDSMHDYLEGVCKYDMIEILIHVTNRDYISLENINLKMDAINFNKFGLNKPPLLKASFLAKRDIAFSASEMKNVVLLFSVAVGDYVPHEQ